MDKVFRIIRILTVPPVFALALLVTAYCCMPGVFASPGELLGFILCLSVLPVLGYPLQRFLPRFREKGREGQRSLAMLFSAAGYLLGLAAALITHASRALLVIDLEHLLCGVCMLVFNRCFRLRASGHTCGVAAPVLLLVFRLYLPAAVGAALMLPVFVSSIRTGRQAAGGMPDRRRVPGMPAACPAAVTLCRPGFGKPRGLFCSRTLAAADPG